VLMAQHQGAIDTARAELKYGHNEELRRLAQNRAAAGFIVLRTHQEELRTSL
jgi:uncharacterized protein (DUF305 family)